MVIFQFAMLDYQRVIDTWELTLEMNMAKKWQSFQSGFSRPDFVPLEFRNHPGLGADDWLEVLKTMRNSLLLLPSRDMVGWRVRPSV